MQIHVRTAEGAAQTSVANLAILLLNLATFHTILTFSSKSSNKFSYFLFIFLATFNK